MAAVRRSAMLFPVKWEKYRPLGAIKKATMVVDIGLAITLVIKVYFVDGLFDQALKFLLRLNTVNIQVLSAWTLREVAIWGNESRDARVHNELMKEVHVVEFQ